LFKQNQVVHILESLNTTKIKVVFLEILIFLKISVDLINE